MRMNVAEKTDDAAGDLRADNYKTAAAHLGITFNTVC